jgi:peptide/nickel transport system permease protein
MMRSSANRTLVIAGVILLAVVVVAIFGPWLTVDPLFVNPQIRLTPPGHVALLGTDFLGRDVLARAIYGARVSLTVGFCVAAFAVFCGLVLGVAAGYWTLLDRLLMRVMEGMMAIPSMLLAIALVALNRPGIGVVVVAIAIPEIPRVARLARSVILSVKEATFVEAARASGVRGYNIVIFHLVPSTLPPLTVQGTYIVASAILIEASLSFLGAGVPSEIPTWGNMIASSRLYLSVAPWTIFVPGALLAVVVLLVNLMGDALRDKLDVRAGNE